MLRDRADALHVRLVASPAHRASVIATRLGISLDEATQRVRDTDAQRTRYHRQWYNRDWADGRNYHLTLNTGWLGIERSAEIVASAIGERKGER
jgi:cytidylate kinase